MRVTINGNSYELRDNSGVHRTPLVEWPENTRLDGQQQRKDRSLLSSWVMNNWSAGLGVEEMNPDIASEFNSLWDVENCDTRYGRQITLSPALQTCTIVPSRGDLNLYLKNLDNLYFLETSRAAVAVSSSMSSPAYSYQFSPPFTIGSFRHLGQIGTPIGSITAITDSGGVTIVKCRQTNWGQAMFSSPTMGGTLTNLFLAFDTAEDYRFSRLLEVGGTIYSTDYTTIGNKNNISFVLVKKAGGGTLVGSFGEFVGSYLAPIVSDGLTVFVSLPSGVYNFDATPNVVVSADRAKDKNPAQVLFENLLYFKNKKSLVEWDGTDTTPVGYDLRDGLKGEKYGEITAMTSSFQWAFAAVKGGTYSHILTMDRNKVWQYYARIPTAGLWVRELFLSDAPDAIDRLWVLFGNHPFPAYFLNPMTNPLSAGTYDFVPTGEFTKPISDQGLGEISTGFFDASVAGGSITGTNNIAIIYGLNGAAPVTTLGIIGTNNQALTFGSPAGVEAFSLQPRFILSSGSTAQTPVFRKSIVHYLKSPDIRETFDFEIDVDKTANFWQKPAEAVIGSLNYEANLKTLMPFWYGQIGTRYVKVLTNPSDERVDNQDIFEGKRDAFIKVTLAEIL